MLNTSAYELTADDLRELSQNPEPFWNLVDKKSTPPHWLWMGRPPNLGYGIYTFKGTEYVAHRIAWQITNNELLGEKTQLRRHRGCPRLCVRPDHMDRKG